MGISWCLVKWAASSAAHDEQSDSVVPEAQSLDASEISPAHSVWMNLTVPNIIWRKELFKGLKVVEGRTQNRHPILKLIEAELPATGIRIHLDGAPVHEADKCNQIAERIATQWAKRQPRRRIANSEGEKSLFELATLVMEVEADELNENTAVAVGRCCRVMFLEQLSTAVSSLRDSIRRLPQEVIKVPIDYPRLERQWEENLATFSGACLSARSKRHLWPTLKEICKPLDDQSNDIARRVTEAFRWANDAAAAKEQVRDRFQRILEGDGEYMGAEQALAEIDAKISRLLIKERSNFKAHCSPKTSRKSG